MKKILGMLLLAISLSTLAFGQKDAHLWHLITYVDFQDFNPSPANHRTDSLMNNFPVEDSCWYKYITAKRFLELPYYDYTLFAFKKNMTTRDYITSGSMEDVNEVYDIPFNDEERFADTIFARLENRKIKVDSLRKMTAHELARLTGKITARQLEYQKNYSTEIPMDICFYDKLGKCVHYAEINAYIYNFLKFFVPNARNTYMKGVATVDSKHEWNEIIAVSIDEQNRANYTITYVDCLMLENLKDLIKLKNSLRNNSRIGGNQLKVSTSEFDEMYNFASIEETSIYLSMYKIFMLTTFFASKEGATYPNHFKVLNNNIH